MADNILRFKILADTKQLGKALSGASSKLKAFGSRMTSVGSSLQTRLALPLIAAGGAAIKMAADFDRSMTQIKTLVGIAGDEVNQMGVAASGMAQQTAISANEAAEALFFITSAGLRGTDAMDVLKQSLQASAIGLGETKVIADLATSALNAYGLENLSASEATDILTGAVREGKLSADSLAQSMGSVLPVASKLGVRFSEVGATFASMSRTGTDATMAATSLRSILFALVKPSAMANKTLSDFDLSAAKLREQIREKGLLSTLKTLTEAFGDNEDAQGKVFSNMKALSGVMDLMGKNFKGTEKIFESMNNTAGLTAEAFDILKESAGFKLDKALNDIGIQFTELGSVLLTALVPLIQKFSKIILGLFEAFQNLSPEMKNFSISLGVLLIGLPTLLVVLGGIASALGAIVGPIGLVVAGIATLAYFSVDLYNIFSDLDVSIRIGILNTLSYLGQQFDLFRLTLMRFGSVVSEFLKNKFDADFTDINKGFDELANNIIKNAEASREANSQAGVLFKKYNDYPSILSQVTKAWTFVNSGIKESVKVTKKVEQNLHDIFGAAKDIPVKLIEINQKLQLDSSKVIEGAEAFKEMDDRVKSVAENTEYWAYTIGDVLADSFSVLMNGGDFFGSLMDSLKKLIIRLAAAAAAAAVLFVLTGGASAGGSSLGSFKTIFAGIAQIPAFASGGIVSGPTLGLMGEYSGARSNPEVVAPLDKLKGIIGQGDQNINIGGEFRLQGQDLVVALQRADRNRSRIK